MRTLFTSLLLLFLFVNPLKAQERPIEIEDELNNNRLNLYAVNKNLQDFDVILYVNGTGFRQRELENHVPCAFLRDLVLK